MPSVDGQGFGGFTAWRAISRTPAPRPHTCMLCSKGSHWSQKSLRRAQLPRKRNVRTVALSRPSGGLGSKGGCWLPLCDQVGPWAPVSSTGKTSSSYCNVSLAFTKAAVTHDPVGGSIRDRGWPMAAVTHACVWASLLLRGPPQSEDTSSASMKFHLGCVLTVAGLSQDRVQLLHPGASFPAGHRASACPRLPKETRPSGVPLLVLHNSEDA